MSALDCGQADRPENDHGADSAAQRARPEPLSPLPQEHVIGLFRASGYSEGLEFDHYAMVYDFDH